MQVPLQISFHNMAASEALERRVREHWAKLERHYDGIVTARIVLEAPHKQPHKSTLGISISIGVPGRDIVVKREQRLHEVDDYAYWVLNEAFAAAQRQLEDYAQRQRRHVKPTKASTSTPASCVSARIKITASPRRARGSISTSIVRCFATRRSTT